MVIKHVGNILIVTGNFNAATAVICVCVRARAHTTVHKHNETKDIDLKCN